VLIQASNRNSGPKILNYNLLHFEVGLQVVISNKLTHLMANSIQADALAQLLIEKGIITNYEYYMKMKQVQKEYQDRKND